MKELTVLGITSEHLDVPSVVQSVICRIEQIITILHNIPFLSWVIFGVDYTRTYTPYLQLFCKSQVTTDNT